MSELQHDVDDCYEYAANRYWHGWMWGFVYGVVSAAAINVMIIWAIG